MRMRIVPRRRPNASYRAVFALLLTVVALPATAGFTGTDVFIPASARAAGLAPAQFYSTLWLTNLSLGATANVQLQFFQRDTSNTAPITVPMAVAPGQTQKFENVVQTLFGLPSASGAIRVLSDQEILATSRTYNLPPGSDIRDANGLFFGGIPQSLSIGIGETTQLQGVSQGGAEDFRYNFGFVETAGSPVTVRIIVRRGDGSLIATKDYLCLAYEAKQFSITDAAPGISAVNARIDASVVSGSGRVLVYGTAVANGSQDSIGFEMSFRSALLSGGVASLNGLTGAVSLAAGSNVTLTPGGNTITISSSGGGGGGVPSVNGITGAVNLLPGTNLSITPSGGNLTFAAGFTSVNGLTGAVSLAAGSNVTLTPSGNTITIGSSGGVPSVNGITGPVGLIAGANISITPAGGGITIAASPGAGLTLPFTGSAATSASAGAFNVANTAGIGVFGTSSGNVGTKGLSTNFNGVWAESTNQDGLFASGGRDGAFIEGARYGAIITTSSAANNAAAVLGVGQAGNYTAGVKGSVGSGPTDNYWAWAGVRGLSSNIGVLGITTAAGGVVGARHTSAGTLQTASYLGYTSTVGLHTIGTTSATGTKFFVEPHPTDPAKVIRYAALEGPEAGTYFRGKAVVQGGVAEIVVPESFRFVTDEEGLTVHVTAVGRASQTWIESADLNRIVIGATRDVTINYIVHGVRKAYKDIEVIADNVEYVPTSATMPIPTSYPEETRRRLVANGTYNPDGTVNMSTAERMGWARVWREQEQAQAKAETPK